MELTKTGHYEFTFPNGDKYIGSFCAHRSGLAWREGFGLYLTHDNQTYSCQWKDDKIDESEDVEILYSNNDRYIGKITKFKYNGPGTYIFENGCRLTSVFLNNKPIGDVLFVDYHGSVWHGKALENKVLLFEEHIFSEELNEDLGKGVRKLTLEGSQEESSSILEMPDISEMEKRIFAKSKMTKSDINFKDSDWYKAFLVKTKIEEIESGQQKSLVLKEEEKLWYQNYLAAEAKREQLMKENCHRSESNLLKIYFSEQYKKACPPIRVFYPTVLYDDFAE